MNRRQWLKTSCYGLSSVSLLGLYSWQIEPFWLEFVELEMPIAELPDALIGKTLMQISDVHVSKRFDHRFLIDAFQKAQSWQPDIVCYTGDYISLHHNQVLYPELNEVFSHAVHGRLGTFGILGNHDYGIDFKEAHVANKISSILTKKGIQILRNQEVQVNGLTIVGLDDLWGCHFAPSPCLKAHDSKAPSIALCHNPDVCDLDVWHDYEGWILAGHTHGGQCKPPFLPPPILPVKNKQYSAGKIQLDSKRTLYINRALGCLQQVRFNARPEITLFKLIKAEKDTLSSM